MTTDFITKCPPHLIAIDGDTAMNLETRRYVIREGSGYSCLGFDNCFMHVSRLEQWHRMEPTQTPCDGMPPEVYYAKLHQRYQDLMKIARLRCDQEKIRCNIDLSPQLIGLEGQRVEVVTTYGEKRRFIVGKSTGWMPIHLEIHNRRSTGGGGAERTYTSVRIVSKP